MTLADDLRAAGMPSAIRRPACSVAVWLASLPDMERDDVRAVLMDPVTNLNAVSLHLRKLNPYAPAGQTLNRHRRGTCACGRPA